MGMVAQAIKDKGERVLLDGRPVRCLVSLETVRYDADQETSVESRWNLRIAKESAPKLDVGGAVVLEDGTKLRIKLLDARREEFLVRAEEV